jgi:glutamyl-tRNA reductase
MIDQLYKRYHQVAQEEVARTTNKFGQISEEEKQHLEELARRIVNKLLHDPIQTLKQSDSLHGQIGQYLHAMERLFRLAGSQAADNTAQPPSPPDQEPDKPL